jgi:hypothetical protein
MRVKHGQYTALVETRVKWTLKLFYEYERVKSSVLKRQEI